MASGGGAGGAGGPPQVSASRVILRAGCVPDIIHVCSVFRGTRFCLVQADCIRAVQHYILKMLRPKDAAKAISGAKALILDRETVGCATKLGPASVLATPSCLPQKTIVSMVQSMSDILSKEGGWAQR